MSATGNPLRAALTANSTASNFTARIPQVTEPSGDGVFDMFDRNVGIGFEPYIPRYLQLVPYGTAANDVTHNMRAWGWSRVGVSNLWIPQLLLELAYTLGNISGAAIGTNHYLSDTIAITYGDTNAALISPAADIPSSIMVHLRGCRYLDFDFKIGSGTAANSYWRAMDQGDEGC